MCAVDSLPLTVFKAAVDMVVDVETMKRSPYCLEKLDGEWAGQPTVELSFQSLKYVRG